MADGNSTLASAEQATGQAPLNSQPKEPQPPQHGAFVKDPTMDTLPPSLQNLPSPLQAFVLGLDDRDSREKNADSLAQDSSYPDSSKFEDLVKAGLRPEGPVRAEKVDAGNVKWPAGMESVEGIVKAQQGNAGQLRAYEVTKGVGKTEVYVVALDLGNERLVGVRFPKQE